MTIAVCVYCGNIKFAALSQCEKCGREPKGSPEIFAKSVVLTDHHLNEKGIRIISDMIQQGNDPLRIPELREQYETYLKLVTNDKGELDMSQMREWINSRREAAQNEPQCRQNSCPGCNRVFEPSERTCPYCNDTPLSFHPKVPDERKRRIPIVSFVLIVIGVLGFGYLKHALDAGLADEGTVHGAILGGIGRLAVSGIEERGNLAENTDVYTHLEGDDPGIRANITKLRMHNDPEALELRRRYNEAMEASQYWFARASENEELEKQRKYWESYGSIGYGYGPLPR